MAHIHELIDLTAGAYIVHNNKVLLVDHKRMEMWTPVGGHVELDEDPEEALLREVKEESGLDITLIGEKITTISDPGVKFLVTPAYMDIHDITDTHKHIGLVYFARSQTDVVQLAEAEHNQIRWFTKEELSDESFGVRPHIRFYAEKALEAAGAV